MVVTALAGWEPFAAAVDPPRRELSHAVIISIDSLRADHLPMYGYPRMTTPFLARLVEEGRARVFERFTAVAPSCNPSHSTMLTGLYPQQIGLPLCGEDLVFKHADAEDEDQIREVMEYQSLLRRTPEPLIRKKLSTLKSWLSIPEGTRTLATFLDEKGYLTGGFVSIWTIDHRFGYARGFDRFEDRMRDYYGPKGLKWLLGKTFGSQRRQPAEQTIEHALDFLEGRDAGEKLFVFVNLADTHVPYSAPEEIGFEEDAEEREILEKLWRSRYPRADYSRAMKRMSQGGELVLDAYDRSIKFTDSLIDRLFERLEAMNLLDDTLVVITTDHGESMGQHRYLPPSGRNGLFFEHSVYVWEEYNRTTSTRGDLLKKR